MSGWDSSMALGSAGAFTRDVVRRFVFADLLAFSVAMMVT